MREGRHWWWEMVVMVTSKYTCGRGNVGEMVVVVASKCAGGETLVEGNGGGGRECVCGASSSPTTCPLLSSLSSPMPRPLSLLQSSLMPPRPHRLVVNEGCAAAFAARTALSLLSCCCCCHHHHRRCC